MLKNDELGIQAYRELRKLIINGILAPGQKIIQEKLAAKLGISRTPLRVALHMLEAENLIEPKNKTGFKVKEIDNKEILEIFDCRIALESTAAGLLAKRINGKEAEKLKSFFLPFENEGLQKGSESYKKADTQFHNFIVEKCGNRYIDKLFKQGNLITYIERIGLIRPPEATLQDHIDIINAIINNDSEEAEKAMKVHLTRSKEIIEEKLINEPVQ
ncbi:MAG: GntR family transcriptional regulator [Lunatimonas sp.]|uniref:GntR family transcriptional regulator n=1 Tax=Lunatimonas sp. TaxID=2060141 RepID=UPI00263A8789|nr:GntR family transcriptional regulator [Lunatimonas sp.]MCC5938653.1 GntR family transcriptional regulator [Lunatimonas sp.]